MKKESIARLLPDIFQAVVGQEGPLDGFLAAQEALHAPSEKVIGAFHETLNPRIAPPEFVYLLAYWMNLDYILDGPRRARHFPGGVGRLRELIALAAETGRQRGSGAAIVRMLETATGLSGYSYTQQSDAPYHVSIIAPDEAQRFRSVIERIIEAEKPAFTTYELVFAPAGAR